MKKWECTICGYIHEGDAPPDECPLCGAGPEYFKEVVDSAEEAPAEAEAQSEAQPEEQADTAAEVQPDSAPEPAAKPAAPTSSTELKKWECVVGFQLTNNH